MLPESSTTNLLKILHIVKQFEGQFSVFIHLSPQFVNLWLLHFHLYGVRAERWEYFEKRIVTQRLKDYQSGGRLDAPSLDVVVVWTGSDLLEFMQMATAPQALGALGFPFLSSLVSMLPVLKGIDYRMGQEWGALDARRYAQRKGY